VFLYFNERRSRLDETFFKVAAYLGIGKKYNTLYPKSARSDIADEGTKEVMNFEILEKRIASLTKEYQENILRAVKAFYEN